MKVYPGPFLMQKTAFLTAIETEHLPTIRLFLRHGAVVSEPCKFGVRRTPLQRAAEMGNIEIVKLLVENGGHANEPAPPRGGGTSLQLAAWGGFTNIVRLLLQKGADVDAPPSDRDGTRHALLAAAIQGRADIVSILVQAGAGSGGKDRDLFRRAIKAADKKGHFPISKMLTHFMETGKVAGANPDWMLEEFIQFEPDG
ncbi:ankyrin repeat-containing domain protein [Stachybotrys elegans]|uniref:Ankyrin repeat-containing domain protein n=1 Tax=Stachybotrys elegans TaxID=80388 RepID=A0A8K0SKR3_9HYPO|nr:ankyrin repeat-containing domain protein [Stachybotrys elegans]